MKNMLIEKFRKISFPIHIHKSAVWEASWGGEWKFGNGTGVASAANHARTDPWGYKLKFLRSVCGSNFLVARQSDSAGIYFTSVERACAISGGSGSSEIIQSWRACAVSPKRPQHCLEPIPQSAPGRTIMLVRESCIVYLVSSYGSGFLVLGEWRLCWMNASESQCCQVADSKNALVENRINTYLVQKCKKYENIRKLSSSECSSGRNLFGNLNHVISFEIHLEISFI